MSGLYAIQREGEDFKVLSVPLTSELIIQVNAIFEQQEVQFLEKVDEDVPFSVDWKPDDNEVFLLKEFVACDKLFDALKQDSIALPQLDPKDFGGLNLRALFIVKTVGRARYILLQSFNAQQVLSNRFSLLFTDSVFRRITDPAFTLAGNIIAIISDTGDLRFKSYHVIRRVFDVSSVFRTATDGEVKAFCESPSLAISNTDAFIAMADESIRKHVVAIGKTGVFTNYTVDTISEQANKIGFPIDIVSGKINVPTEKKDVKKLLSFLSNKIYRGPLSDELLITNSHRPLA